MDQDYHRILEVVTRFQLVFDQKNWDAFDELLADQLEVDYFQFRGEPLCVVSCREYKGSRQQALSHLRLQHNLSNPLIRIEQDQAWQNVIIKFIVFQKMIISIPLVVIILLWRNNKTVGKLPEFANI